MVYCWKLKEFPFKISSRPISLFSRSRLLNKHIINVLIFVSSCNFTTENAIKFVYSSRRTKPEKGLVTLFRYSSSDHMKFSYTSPRSGSFKRTTTVTAIGFTISHDNVKFSQLKCVIKSGLFSNGTNKVRIRNISTNRLL